MVVSANVAYLVTAKHVASEMGPNFKIIMEGDNGKPIQITLLELTGQPALQWCNDDKADI